MPHYTKDPKREHNFDNHSLTQGLKQGLAGSVLRFPCCGIAVALQLLRSAREKEQAGRDFLTESLKTSHLARICMRMHEPTLLLLDRLHLKSRSSCHLCLSSRPKVDSLSRCDLCSTDGVKIGFGYWVNSWDCRNLCLRTVRMAVKKNRKKRSEGSSFDFLPGRKSRFGCESMRMGIVSMRGWGSVHASIQTMSAALSAFCVVTENLWANRERSQTERAWIGASDEV